MTVYLLEVSTGQYDEARDTIVGIYDSIEKAEIKKEEVELVYKSAQDLEVDDEDESQEAHEIRMRKYYAQEFNGCTIYPHEVQ
jgi:hypothetical protein